MPEETCKTSHDPTGAPRVLNRTTSRLAEFVPSVHKGSKVTRSSSDPKHIVGRTDHGDGRGPGGFNVQVDPNR